MQLSGKTAFITGGDQGIGAAIALKFAKEGADVVITYFREKEKADEIVRRIQQMGRKAKAIQADASKNDVQRVVKDAIDFLGHFDILVNNAGVYTRRPFLDITEDEYDYMMNVNAKGPFLITQGVVKEMVKRAQGVVLFISSFRDKVATSNMAHYQMSKAAVTMFGKVLAHEVAPYNIRSNVISPGMVLTRMHEDDYKDPVKWQARLDTIPLGRSGTVEDIANAALHLASDNSNYITGTRHVVDGGRSLAPWARAKL